MTNNFLFFKKITMSRKNTEFYAEYKFFKVVLEKFSKKIIDKKKNI
jgi:hypothetical protein